MPSSMDDARATGLRGRDAAADPHNMPGYETRDANTQSVLGFLVVLFVALGLTLLGTWQLFRFYAVTDQQPAPASSFADERQIPPEPELAVNGRDDLLKMYAKQRQELDTYAWEDRKAGTVRVPIDRAMDLLLQKGLPVSVPEAGAQ
jgi:hypothetical protein